MGCVAIPCTGKAVCWGLCVPVLPCCVQQRCFLVFGQGLCGDIQPLAPRVQPQRWAANTPAQVASALTALLRGSALVDSVLSEELPLRQPSMRGNSSPILYQLSQSASLSIL